MPKSKRTTFGYGYAVGRKLKHSQRQVCERCAKEFTLERLVPYCLRASLRNASRVVHAGSR